MAINLEEGELIALLKEEVEEEATEEEDESLIEPQ